MITQGGKRDGANMAVMSVHHPDIEEFIDCKRQEGEIHNFNISVGATDAFMKAVADGGSIAEIDPVTQEPTGVERDARGLFKKIVEGAWRNGEPGMIFLDEVNRRQPTPHLGSMEATNPCGEQPLLPYESCNLGSINLIKMLSFGPDGAVIDWDLLRSTVAAGRPLPRQHHRRQQLLRARDREDEPPDPQDRLGGDGFRRHAGPPRRRLRL